MNNAKKFLFNVLICLTSILSAFGLVSCNFSAFNAPAEIVLHFILNDSQDAYAVTPVFRAEEGPLLGLPMPVDVVIPAKHKGLPVTSVTEEAFARHSDLISVKIPESITLIGEKAFFGCSNLTKITVDENNLHYKSIDGNLYTKDGKTLVQYAIGKEATAFTVPDGVTAIAPYAFAACNHLTSVVLPNSMEIIGVSAFEDCGNLTNVTIPDSVKIIEKSAFYKCDSLASAAIPDSVEFIGAYAFRYCNSLTSISFIHTASAWHRTHNATDWKNKTNGTKTDVTNSADNATYFKETYCNYYWYKL